ncbi:hypothetical protein T210_0127445 [Burkholderia pseudomallei MSHR6137]|nr:hypothetical protein T210_0127445 [Burkholderia pseudomallei MSHR6137]
MYVGQLRWRSDHAVIYARGGVINERPHELAFNELRIVRHVAKRIEMFATGNALDADLTDIKGASHPFKSCQSVIRGPAAQKKAWYEMMVEVAGHSQRLLRVDEFFRTSSNVP